MTQKSFFKYYGACGDVAVAIYHQAKGIRVVVTRRGRVQLDETFRPTKKKAA